VIKCVSEKGGFAHGQKPWTACCQKVIVPMAAPPVAGLIGGFCVMGLLLLLVQTGGHCCAQGIGRLQFSARLSRVGTRLRRRAENHGNHRPATSRRLRQVNWENLSRVASFLYSAQVRDTHVDKSIVRVVMAGGTWAGRRIIERIGHKLVHLKPVHGFAPRRLLPAFCCLRQTRDAGFRRRIDHHLDIGVGKAEEF